MSQNKKRWFKEGVALLMAVACYLLWPGYIFWWLVGAPVVFMSILPHVFPAVGDSAMRAFTRAMGGNVHSDGVVEDNAKRRVY